MPFSPLSPADFHDALYHGKLRKVIRAAQAGTAMHPLRAIHLAGGSPRLEELSPLTLARRWDWTRRPGPCLEALDALLAAGAEPNRPDAMGRLALPLLLFAVGDNLPRQATDRLLAAGANPLVPVELTAGRRPLNALGVCLLDVLPDHARAILAHSPEASAAAVSHPDVVALDFLSLNRNKWAAPAAQAMVGQLLLAGATLAHAPLAAADPTVRQWVDEALAGRAQQRLEGVLPAPVAKALPAPRL